MLNGFVPARAAVITWSSPGDITADSDIATNGTAVYGGYYSSTGGTVMLNGVAFVSSAGSDNLPGTSVSFDSTEFGDPSIGAGTGLSADYRTVLGGRVWHSLRTNVNTVTLTNLAIGTRYLVQVWNQDSRTWGFGRTNLLKSGGNTAVLDYNLTEVVGGRGQYVTGTFQADSGSQSFTMQSATLSQLNALQLRRLPDLTDVAISVNATQVIRTVDNRLFSANTAIYDAQLHGPATVPLLFEQDNQALRWPGGSYGNTFHQATEDSRPSYEPRTTNLLYIARHTGAQLFMTANYGTGSPEEAADWVRYVNLTNGAGAKYWEVGNENYGTWEQETVIAPFTTNDVLDLPSLAAKLHTPSNNISSYVRGTLSSSTLTTLSNYMASPGPYAASLRSALVNEFNQLVNGTPNPVKVYETNRFAGITLRTVTASNVALPIPTVGQDVNNRMVLEDAFAVELAKVTPAVDLAADWPDVYLPHEGWTYAQRFAQYYAQMKAVDPSIKVGVVGLPNETSSANSYTHHPAVNPRTGATNYGWMAVILDTLGSLGVTPDFIAYHNYAGSGDAALLQWSRTLATHGTNLQQMLADYLGASAATNVELCITEIGPSGSDQSSTSLVGGLFLADNSGQALLSPFSARLWWAFRNGGSSVAANTNIYGWRNFHDYGQVPRTDSTALTNRYPTYYAGKLMQYFARGGDEVVAATSDSSLLTAYAVKRASGALALLVINKSPVLTHTGNISFAGFNAGTNVTVWSYGIPQDEAARTGVGSADLAVTNFAVPGPSGVSLTFAPYSMSVLSFAPEDAVNLERRLQSRITFTNYTRAEVLTNFPALVVLGTNVPGFDPATFSSPTAGDLRFTSGDGAESLSFEIERWNPYGDSHVWVRIPRFTNNVSVLAQWGGPDRELPVTSTNGGVWTNDYVGVWHLSGLAATDSARAADAVLDGTPTVLGRVGVGRCFRGFSVDTVEIPWASVYNLATNFEVQGWFKVDPTEKPAAGEYITLSNKEGAGGFSDRNWWIAIRSDGRLWWRSSPGIDITNTTDLANGVWRHFSAVHDGTAAHLYVDGVRVATDASPGTVDVQTAPVLFGELQGNARRMQGLLDEMRISRVRRSSNWVWASYQTMASNRAFTSYGAATSNAPPVLGVVADRVIGAGVTLVVTNTATDPDLPAQTLSYALLSAPAGATLNTNSGLLTWRPTVAQAASSHGFTVRVADSGLPSLSHTRSFLVQVNPLNAPVVGRPQFTNGQVRLTIQGDFGPDYTVQVSGDLISWTNRFVTNSPTLPFIWTDSEATNVSTRFYRVRLGP
jgi:hypothetical protein